MGLAAWSEFLQANLNNLLTLNTGESKTVSFNFKVDYKGEINNIRILQSAGEPFDKEVIRLVKAMPKWIPYTFNGKPNGITLTQQITFTRVKDVAVDKANL